MSTTPHRLKAMASKKMPESPLSVIQTPESASCRRSLRLAFSPQTTPEACHAISEDNVDKMRTAKKSRHLLFSPEKTPSKHSSIDLASPNPSQLRKKMRNAKKRSNYKKLVCDGADLEVGDDVHATGRVDANFDEHDPEVEECRICFEIGSSLMIECEDCLGGFHLQCLKPPLHEVSKGDWICEFCEAKKSGRKVKLARPLDGEKRLSGDLGAMKIGSPVGGMSRTPHRSKKMPESSLSVIRTPESASCRRSLRLSSPQRTPEACHNNREDNGDKMGTAKKSRHLLFLPEKTPSKRSSVAPATPNPSELRKKRRYAKKRSYYKKLVCDGGEFKIREDVYVRRRDDAESDEDDPEVEECRICFEIGSSLMIECEDCLGGFHLQCLKPPLCEVPEGEWICEFCEAKKLGKKVKLPMPSDGKKLRRTMREKLLSGDLWAAKIESLWKEPDGTYWLKCRWYVIPEETTSGRQPHNLRRELYLTNHLSDIEIESVLRHCYVMNPREFAEANNEGDDVFYCEYEYDVRWHSFKRLSEVADTDNDDEAENDGDWTYSNDSGCDSEEDSDFDDDTMGKCSSQNVQTQAANSRRGRIFGLHKIGLKKIPEHVRLHKPTDLERAKSTLLLTALPKTLPCRTKEMEEITSFIKGAICEDDCLGRCLYIHGVPGTGKTMTVLTVLRNLRAEVDAGRMRPYCFVEVNGLKLSSPENIYRVIYEAMSGHRVGWKKALGILNERFSEGVKIGKEENRPCILLIDELDLLLTRNQSVLYNIFDWPSKPYSKLIVIGIANTMDLPEKFLPRISSRLGIQRLCFGPYNYQQLQEIIASRLKGVDAFEEQAIEFASRKVAAMSGDARRALEICRRAAEVADYRIKRLSQSSNGTSLRDSLSEGKHLVGLNDVESAIHEVFQAPHIQVMKNSSRLSKVLLTAMVHELYRSGLGEVSFEKLATTIRSLCSSNREPVPKWDDLLKVSCKLGECRIILSEDGTKHRLRRMQLNFPSDDVTFALKDCPEISWLSKYL